MWKVITIEEALNKENLKFIDVRSPSEFQIDTIPGAVNVPLLNDVERDKVGKVYKNEGSQAAKLLGFKLIATRLPELVNEIVYHTSNHDPVIFCWRGGMRSRAVVTLLDLLEIRSYQLKGGYKAYRRLVNSFFNEHKVLPIDFIVIYGLTGVGKTEVLKELKLLGENVVDLEEIANNRGSVFGAIGLGPQPSQKAFETRLYEKLTKVKKNSPFYVECESKRIGRLLIPDSMFKAMEKGRKVLLYDDLENRIRRIVQEYSNGGKANIAELSQAIIRLKKRLGEKRVNELMEWLQKGEYKKVVGYLLENYYDPLYDYPNGPDNRFELSVKNNDPKKVARLISDYFNKIKNVEVL